MASTDGTSQVRIHLKTRSPDLELPQDTGPILVSTELKRYQLSTLVNRLLETEKPVPLEFLINGQFLRTSLDEFLTQNGISAETTLSVEYVKALVPPLFVSSYEHDDWVSSLDVLSQGSRPAQWAGERAGAVSQRILTGSYDGLLRVWNMSNDVVATGQGHTAAVKAAKFISPQQVVSSGVDRTLRLWKFDDAEGAGAGSLTPTMELYGHRAAVENLAVHAPSSRILSASSDHSVGLWSTKKSEAPAAPETLLPSNKRRKLSSTSKASPQRGPLSMLQGHQSQVADVCFDEKDSTVAYSASWDHSVKTWDLTTSACVDTRTTAQSLFSICHLPEAGLLATGTSARHITLIDPRVDARTVSAMTLRGHMNAVVSLARDPNSSYQIVSGSHDGTCRIWDIRSARQDATDRVGEAVYVIDRESAKGKPRSAVGEGVKVFGVQWDPEVGIVSGGEDKRVQINKGSS
ncbi:Ribosome biogenesis protein [Hortaea werneckii]|nr:Ribosome biogenesis protein [Hortaea werneckii]KAI7331638.1 Ribosome biogenesis protein [Hortaea werneckii]KAI7339154.1 Ribosome biogenesis protein [Hortaea werneckii]KAI7369424.1 Ribosome biogenesis protein [Hortaea werneckii]KAI7405371.1 Ribosome biogenesis protein [Hortaea werneckii]